MNKWVVFLIAELFILAGLFVGYNAFVRDKERPDDRTEPTTEVTATEFSGISDNIDKAIDATETEADTDVSITVTAVGDCTLAQDASFAYHGSFASYYDENGTDYFLKNVKDIFTADDLTIANLECVISDNGTRADKKWAFRSDAKHLEILKNSGVEAVSFANNHCKDYGEISYKDTMLHLDEYEIAYSSFEIIEVLEVKGKKIGMLSINALTGLGTSKAMLEKDMEALKQENCDLIIASFHWGEEGSDKLTEKQKVLSHLAIDLGAHLVIGHHPHILQGVEVYQNRTILYSLGNFCFGGNQRPQEMDTAIYQQTFRFTDEGLVEAYEAKVIPCSVSSNKDRNNYQPTVLEGTDYTRVLDKLRTRSKQFSTKFDDAGGISD